MKENMQVRVTDSEFKATHKEQLNTVFTRIAEIVPKSSKLEGHIAEAGGQYEGRIHIRSKIGAFVAKAKSRNLFSLIAKLQAKILRQLVNWREKKAAKKRYLRRKDKLVLVHTQNETAFLMKEQP